MLASERGAAIPRCASHMDAKAIHLLLLEDNAGDARLIRELLKEVRGPVFEVTLATRLSDALDAVAAGRLDIILTDLTLPDCSGLEAFRALRAAAPATPVVVLSGVDDEEFALGAVREGAQDYLAKGRLEPHLLGRSIRYAIERQHAEEKLISSEAFYHSLVEHLPQNIFRKNLAERFTFANQRFCQLLGKPLNEIIGKTDFDFYPVELASKYQQDDREVIRTGRPLETLERNVTPGGETIYVNVVKTPILDANGQVLGTQCIFWDMTERKRFEEQLQQKNIELACTAEALQRANAELKSAQLQLIQAEKMESLGTLAAGVAHEVKNPLAILQMGINYLLKKVPSSDENIAMVLQEMLDAIGRADAITHGLLDFAASKQLVMRGEDFNELIEGSLKLVRHALNDSQIEITTDLAEPPPRVMADRTQIQQVFVNLFVNAVHAMPEGGRLHIRTYPKEMTETTHYEGSRKSTHLWVGDAVVVAEVTDSGSGIPEVNLAKIFDPFFTTKPTGQGTGLGLPVSKKIIELHGGSISIRNRPEGGVKVTVILKQAKEET